MLLDTFVEWTGYTRKHAIRLLNHGEYDQQTIQRHRLPQYCQEVQQALFPAWKAAHYVCAKREEDRPGFVEVDLVAHCGDHLDGSFLYTMTLTDLATGWTECIPLLEKSADCPSMLRETYALRFLQAGGALTALQTQLGIVDLVSMKRYQPFCEQHHQGREAQKPQGTVSGQKTIPARDPQKSLGAGRESAQKY